MRSKHILVQSHGASLKPKITNFYNVARVSKDGQADVDISTWNKALGRYYAPEVRECAHVYTCMHATVSSRSQIQI